MRTLRIPPGIAPALVAVLLTAGCATLAPEVDQPDTTSGITTEQDEDFGTVEVYSVTDEGTLDPDAQGLTAEVWDTFTRVTTIDFAAEVMTQYRVGDAPDSDTLAYVYQDDDPEYWVLAANLATSEDPTQLIATLIHEYAHILTLDTTEVVPGHSCPGLLLDEGCATEVSMIQAFTDQFWTQYGDAAPDATNSDSDVAYDFYLEHEDDFVSDYAATNVVEDIAESFMTFVLEDEPSGDSVVAQKLLFFWGYPQMVVIRERIRAEFTDDLGLAN
ncbi:hypothetical protein BH10ACT7_BH10ACT7_17920 [soil metagenome]